MVKNIIFSARVAELADALDLGSVLRAFGRLLKTVENLSNCMYCDTFSLFLSWILSGCFRPI